MEEAFANQCFFDQLCDFLSPMDYMSVIKAIPGTLSVRRPTMGDFFRRRLESTLLLLFQNDKGLVAIMVGMLYQSQCYYLMDEVLDAVMFDEPLTVDCELHMATDLLVMAHWMELLVPFMEPLHYVNNVPIYCMQEREWLTDGWRDICTKRMNGRLVTLSNVPTMRRWCEGRNAFGAGGKLIKF